ncbi:MAG TPA: sigma-54 dependent transcriptional regulator [Longimicrobiales bacterium]|nr:sigma-54 dependent transcriptional regulator [Longimicrobiales bacterium]
MAEQVVVTTDDIEAAVPLRDAFQEQGYAVELLTPTERLADVAQPLLLVLTGNLDQKRARRLAREAAQHGWLPVIGLADGAVSLETRRRLGLAEVFQKSADADEVALIGHRLMERQRLREITGIVGRTEAMEEVIERITQIAPVSSTVLITGESGTGKELVARGIHALSPRHGKPFVAANVAALPETLLESELFGHERGAFTGAESQRRGFFELAHGGTLFLDEIGEMPMPTQTKLLRVLEQREFMRVGGEEPLRVDVRVLTATNRDLRERVEVGEFRRDLFFRLDVLRIELPPLRQRREDIPLLMDVFVEQAAREHDLPPVVVSPEAMKILVEYHWPGNIRELKNLVESLVVLGNGRVIGPDDLPAPVRSGPRERPALPVHVPQPAPDAQTSPALEFMFRMMLQLRLDVDDLRREFESYRREHPDFPGPLSLPYPYPYLEPGEAEPARPGTLSQPFDDEPEDEEGGEEGVVVFRPGMTMRDMEREAIMAALAEVNGNRRAAAEALGIGERTLYRKIKEYDIPL